MPKAWLWGREPQDSRCHDPHHSDLWMPFYVLGRRHNSFPSWEQTGLRNPCVCMEPAPCASRWGLLIAPGLMEFQTAMQPCQAYFPSYTRVHLEDLLNPLNVRPGCVLTCCLNFPCLLRDSCYLWLGKQCLISWLFLLVFRMQ